MPDAPVVARIDLLASVLARTADVVAGVRPEQLDRPTPCEAYDVRGLLQHLIGWQQVMAAALADAPLPFADGSPTYVASADLEGDLRAGSASLLAALRSYGPDEVVLPYRGVTPVDVMLLEQIAEAALHTWDLARGLGRPFDLAADELAAAHEGLDLMLQESFAAAGFKDAPSMVPGDGGLARLLARSGRNPAWHPPTE
ncbi:TIGR03086 family metal-binding protein [Luteipulveratus sp. YIM 133132]|uniref:TIGR03086 family metal-binding protein n=1 Tax=Luteipulveratus flavus TaxID=3031728 RepID=UPI0023B2031C|nr:TIGR03086 family metal-binding protein [Luteipulveratus sp. YIM 133132]MDE9364415.1 TIGR03086 family metal-binding protein [Luteipulveratus sp. YIM 133132]